MTRAPGAAFDLQGHRGARGLWPENTLGGFERTIALGVPTLETDLHVTADDVVVVCHDPRPSPELVRAADGRWLAAPGPAIRDTPLADLGAYDVGRMNPASPLARCFPHQQPLDGERIPTLAQLFAACEATGGTPRYNLEVKSSPLAPQDAPAPPCFAALVVSAVRAAGLVRRAAIQSFDWRVLAAVRDIAPEIALGALTECSAEWSNVRTPGGRPSPWLAGFDVGRPGASVPEMVRQLGCTTWSPAWADLDADQVTQAHALGLRVVPWTVNEPTAMEGLIALGVDGLITDRPDRARTVLERRGIAIG